MLPPLAPVMLLNLLLITIYTLNTFDMILPLTGGGPARGTEVVSLYMYRSAFYDLDSGKAAAIARRHARRSTRCWRGAPCG